MALLRCICCNSDASQIHLLQRPASVCTACQRVEEHKPQKVHRQRNSNLHTLYVLAHTFSQTWSRSRLWDRVSVRRRGQLPRAGGSVLHTSRRHRRRQVQRSATAQSPYIHASICYTANSCLIRLQPRVSCCLPLFMVVRDNGTTVGHELEPSDASIRPSVAIWSQPERLTHLNHIPALWRLPTLPVDLR